MHQMFPRLLVVSGSALLVKKNTPFRDPVCHNSQNKSNKHGRRKKQCSFFCCCSVFGCKHCDSGFIHSTIPVEPTWAATIQTSHFRQSMKGYCFFVFPLLHCFSFYDCFSTLLLCLDCYQAGAGQSWGVVSENGSAL